jgi:hypothetical protein
MKKITLPRNAGIVKRHNLQRWLPGKVAGTRFSPYTSHSTTRSVLLRPGTRIMSCPYDPMRQRCLVPKYVFTTIGKRLALRFLCFFFLVILAHCATAGLSMASHPPCLRMPGLMYMGVGGDGCCLWHKLSVVALSPSISPSVAISMPAAFCSGTSFA